VLFRSADRLNRGIMMKIGLVVLRLTVLGVLAANPTYASQPPQATAKAGAKPAPGSSVGGAASPRGSLGGPVNKGPSINGTGMGQKH
jgi:hypothetical protein